jgi:hypothetical protein
MAYNFARLRAAGLDQSDAHELRRIAMTLSRWHKLECGVEGNHGPQSTISIERDGDEPFGKPFTRFRRPLSNGVWHDTRYPCADREKGALTRLAKVMKRYPALRAYVQTDPRGHSLFILRPEDIRGELDQCYSNGIAVHR